MSNVTHPQPSTNGHAPACNGTLPTLDRPDRLNLHAVWAQLERLHNDFQTARQEPPRGQDAPLFKVVLATVAGCTTPVLALAMSTLTGTVAGHGGWPGWFALLPAAVLV